MKTLNALRGRRKEAATDRLGGGKAIVGGEGALGRGVQVEPKVSFLPSF